MMIEPAILREILKRAFYVPPKIRGFRETVRYIWRKTLIFLNICPDCGTIIQRTPTGIPVCPHCIVRGGRR
jgi:ribosomal protein L32